jgi:hypothetical protein
MALKVFEVNKLAFHGAIRDGPWQLVLLSARVRHRAVVIGAIRIATGRAISWGLVDTAISSDGSIGDV